MKPMKIGLVTLACGAAAVLGCDDDAAQGSDAVDGAVLEETRADASESDGGEDTSGAEDTTPAADTAPGEDSAVAPDTATRADTGLSATEGPRVSAPPSSTSIASAFKRAPARMKLPSSRRARSVCNAFSGVFCAVPSAAIAAKWPNWPLRLPA